MSRILRRDRPRLAVVLHPGDRLDARGVPESSVAIVAMALARTLATDFEIAVVAPARRALPASGPDGIRLLPVPVPDARREHLRTLLDILRPADLPPFARPDYHLGYWRGAAAALVGFAPDIVHLHAYAQGLPVLREALARARFLLHLHDPHPALLPRHCLGPAMALADRILAVSAFLRDRLRTAFPELAARIASVPNGVDLPRFPATAGAGSPEGAQILQVGRISPEKGHHVLVRAFARICTRFPRARLVLVGRPGFFPWGYARLLADDAPMRAALPFWGETLLGRVHRQILRPQHAYLEDLQRLLPPGARDRLEFRPPVPHDRLAALYAEADLVAVPSVIEEPFGLPAVEGMAAARAVVASDRGGIPECVEHGASGLLVPAGDDRALAEALLALLADPARRQEMGRYGRERAALFDWSRAGARLRELVSGLAQSPPATHPANPRP